MSAAIKNKGKPEIKQKKRPRKEWKIEKTEKRKKLIGIK